MDRAETKQAPRFACQRLTMFLGGKFIVMVELIRRYMPATEKTYQCAVARVGNSSLFKPSIATFLDKSSRIDL